jgi:hypothetical protein
MLTIGTFKSEILKSSLGRPKWGLFEGMDRIHLAQDKVHGNKYSYSET